MFSEKHLRIDPELTKISCEYAPEPSGYMSVEDWIRQCLIENRLEDLYEYFGIDENEIVDVYVEE